MTKFFVVMYQGPKLFHHSSLGYKAVHPSYLQVSNLHKDDFTALKLRRSLSQSHHAMRQAVGSVSVVQRMKADCVQTW